MLKAYPTARRFACTSVWLLLAVSPGCRQAGDAPTLDEIRQEELQMEEADIAETAMEDLEDERAKESDQAVRDMIKQDEQEAKNQRAIKNLEEQAKETPEAFGIQEDSIVRPAEKAEETSPSSPSPSQSVP